ncbi:hypothetical protein [Catenulispora rubra]|uniref:hypothetical protein n=1 Tax=Catenulispora rubra TaxID=280293 RepID=UPI001892612E|nr:hypothetical protein [Catenulispora rubra]
MTVRTEAGPLRLTGLSDRRRRWWIVAAAVLAVVGVATVVGVVTHRSSGRAVSVLAPARGDATPSDIAAVGWVDSGQACYGSAVPADFTRTEKHHCVAVPSTGNGSPVLWSKPHFLSEPHPMDGKTILAVGFVTGGVTSVEVTMASGDVVSSKVVTLSGGGSTGAYALWLPMTAQHSISWTDIAAVTGRNSSGHAVARLS